MEKISSSASSERLTTTPWLTSETSVRKRILKSNSKHTVSPQVLVMIFFNIYQAVIKSWHRLLGEQEVIGASVRVKPREVDRLRPSIGSRPASDTDDTMWEELLQGPDSPSTGSTDSEGNGRYNAPLPLPQTTTQSSDDDTLQQGITGVRTSENFELFVVSLVLKKEKKISV